MSYNVYCRLAEQACSGAGNVRICEVVFWGPLAVRSHGMFLRTLHALGFKKAKTYTKNPLLQLLTAQSTALKNKNLILKISSIF